MMNIRNFDELFRQIRQASSIENFMHMTQTKLLYPEIHIQHVKTIKFLETNMTLWDLEPRFLMNRTVLFWKIWSFFLSCLFKPEYTPFLVYRGS